MKINQLLPPRLSHKKEEALSKIHKIISYRYFRPLLFSLLLLTLSISSWAIKAHAMSQQDIQVVLAEKILRFHVIANSDSEADQSLKLLVKDTLVASLRPELKDAKDLGKVRSILQDKLPEIAALAEATIQQQGYSYAVKVTLEDCYFPLKVYGKYTFPPGYYQALRVQIGKAEGKNWWCVMFPPLCFVDETYSIVDEDANEKLLQLLSDEEYETLISNKVPVKVKFKLLEELKELLKTWH